MRLLVLLCLTTLSGTSVNAQTNFWPIVTLGTIYSDNVNLAGPGLEQDDLMFEVSPGFLLESAQRNLDIYAEYQIQALFYNDRSDADEVYQQADLNATWKIVPDRFFLEASGSHGQQVVDPEQPFSFSNISVTDNRTDATQYAVGPRLQFPFAKGYALEASGRHTEVYYDDPALVDASADRVDLTFGNLESLGAFAWGLQYAGERLEYDIGPEVEQQQAAAQVRAGTVNLGITGLFGIESDYEQPSAGSLEDEYWELGVLWTGSRYALEAGFGERSFGDTYRLKLSAETNTFAASLSYSEEPSTPARVQLERRQFSDAVFDDLLDRPGTPERFVQKRFEANVLIPMSDGDLTITAQHDLRDQRFSLTDSQTLADEDLTTLRVEWNRQLGLRTAISLDGNWGRRDFGTAQGEDDNYQLGAGFVYRLGRRTTILARYTWTNEDSEGVSNRDDYTENQASLYLIWSPSNSGTRLGTGRPRRSFD